MRRNVQGISAEGVEHIFTAPSDEHTEFRRGVIGVCTVRIQHGPMQDVLTYPVYARTPETVRKLDSLKKATTPAQKKVNRERSFRRLQYLANTNFEEGDVMLSPSGFKLDGDEAQASRRARRIAQSFIAKLRRHWRKKGRELKYIYTIERTDGPVHGRLYHLHILLNAHDFDRDWLESLWTRSACNTRRFQDNDEFFSGMAGYFAPPRGKEGQEKAGRRYWECSRNLQEPRITKAYHKFTVRKIEQIARSLEMDARAILESAYPEYRCTRDVACSRSDFMPGVHMYARMRRKDGRNPAAEARARNKDNNACADTQAHKACAKERKGADVTQ